jgi:hypothetical protein
MITSDVDVGMLREIADVRALHIEVLKAKLRESDAKLCEYETELSAFKLDRGVECMQLHYEYLQIKFNQLYEDFGKRGIRINELERELYGFAGN